MENEDVEKFMIKKIPLKGFIETLVMVLNQGIEFIDIVGEMGPQQDSVYIIVSEEDEDDVSTNINFNELV